MKKIAFVLALVVSPAFAQQKQPTIEELNAQYMFETGELRMANGRLIAQIIQLRKEIADLKVKGEEKPEDKK